MRLTSIEISGFKSFPERSQLAFDGGVTAIVGPNGCGKSNVIDAISWVLGEQSARSLRGERMEDVIFSGSDGRRATATAEVRIQLSEVTQALAGMVSSVAPTLISDGAPPPEESRPDAAAEAADADDAPEAPDAEVPPEAGTSTEPFTNGSGDGATEAASDEPAVSSLASDLLPLEGVALADPFEDDGPVISRDVEVGRRLYRSGESEYLIDGRVCRLRDIQDLLMDSGVGVKAYAVIEQGKIGQILGARPMERRQLLEEAAGVTKYKTRRRSAELKLEAAQQNLTRVDDIVFEVEKQRGALKRQAAKARRYRRLREELRYWEKVQFARRSDELTAAIETATRRLEETRERERGAAAGLSALETTHEQLQIELTESEQGATEARDAAHAHELEMGRRQQRIEFDRSQVESFGAAIAEGESELARLQQREAPLAQELAEQGRAAEQCDADRAAAGERLNAAQGTHADALRAIQGLEGDVEASRSEVFAAINAATALQNVVDHAIEARGQIAEELTKLSAEATEIDTETGRLTTRRREVSEAVERVTGELEAIRLERGQREAELEASRRAHDECAAELKGREQELTSLSARVRSLEELVASREGYSDAARLVLSDASGRVVHHGAVADHLEVDRRYERAVEASLGDLLQYVVVPTLEMARTGMELAAGAGRCGFVVADRAVSDAPASGPPTEGLTPLSDLVTCGGDAAPAVRALLARRWLAPSADAAAEAARVTGDAIVTADGTVFRGPVVDGGGKAEARGILARQGEIRELRVRRQDEEREVTRAGDAVRRHAEAAAAAEVAVKALEGREHDAEKQLLGEELQATRLDDDLKALHEKAGLLRTESREAEERRDGLDARQSEARESIARLETEQKSADERFNTSQRRLVEARARVEALATDVTDAKTTHAALVERAGALAADVARLMEAATELQQRITQRATDNRDTDARREALRATIAASEAQLATDAERFDELRDRVRTLDDRTADVRTRIETQVRELRQAREQLEAVRAEVARLDVNRATAESDLAHLATACEEALQIDLDAVQRELEASQDEPPFTLEAPSRSRARDAEADETPEEGAEGGEDDADTDGAEAASAAPATPEDRISELRDKVDRLGPVNMMAIDQFDELEERFEFLTTQRQDLLDSIQATEEAIARIDTTTRERFKTAFTAVNEYFQQIFGTLFGGGRAGLVLIDESDVLESGIDIIAQPPGKHLQNIQLLSGGEKALTAMALMFAIFRFKPSPFCLLDEIDAPLDDANIGRFVEMLQGMQDYTQFVLVTHNRKTMEIADRLYGVTMEEPGVSKLISVDLH